MSRRALRKPQASWVRPCQARFMNSRRIFDLAHCRRFGKCARLRTIENRKRAGIANRCLRSCAQNWQIKGLKSRSAAVRDTKSPQGRNASRAWPVAYAPNRILNPCSRRSQRSLLPLSPASQRHRQQDSAYPIDPKALNLRAMPAAGVLGIDSGQLTVSVTSPLVRNAQPEPVRFLIKI
jgi:hypothetical protein